MKTIKIILIIFLLFQLSVFAQEVTDFIKYSEHYGFDELLHEDSRLGRAIDTIGDLNGDGVMDLVITAYCDDDGGNWAGAAYIVFMNDDGSILSQNKISILTHDFEGQLEEGDNFGHGVACIGDINQDGINDIAVGAEYDDDGGTWNGAVYIIMLDIETSKDGKTKGIVKRHQKISEYYGGFTGDLNSTTTFGSDIAFMGDIDGDGIGDIAVGARRDFDGGDYVGAVWILFLNNDGTVKTHQKISTTHGNFTADLDNYDFFGSSVENLGDLDGNGVNDLGVGARNDDDGGYNCGAVYILYLNSDGTVNNFNKISDSYGSFSGVLSSGDLFGISISNLGDINQDGVVDIAVGANRDDDGAEDGGAIYILHLDENLSVASYNKITEGVGGFEGDLDEEDYWGISIANIGDDKLMVGAIRDDDGYENSGAAYLLSFAPSSGQLTDSLILYYPFSGNANDLSGNDIHGDAYATLTTDRYGFPNSAYHFDGNSEFVEIPYDPKIKPDLPVTISLWAYFEENSGNQNYGIFTNEYLENYYTGVWMTYHRENKIAIAYGDGGGISEYSRRSKTTLQSVNLNQWYHIVGVIRGAEDMEIYINCIEDQGYYDGLGGPLNYAYDSYSGVVGKNYNGQTRFFHGKLDEIAFWNRALTPEEIEIFCCNGGGLTDLERDFNEKRSIARVYPNPATTQITVEIFNSTSLSNRFVLFDLLGNQVLSAENIVNVYTTFNIENLKSGIYVYSVFNQNSDSIERGKIMIK